MCFTMFMSALLGSVSLAWAFYEWKQFRCLQYSLGLGYWGLMEWLQFAQHWFAASPDDNYAMCNSRINQELTNLAGAHFYFQPVFVSMCLMSMYRRYDITARIEADLLFNVTLAGACWFSAYPIYCLITNQDQLPIPKATPEYPNYQWMHEGYDGFLHETTPNLLHKACTYYPPTNTSHLAWAVPMYRQSYFVPSASLHCFLFFCPYLVMFKRQFVQCAAAFLFLTGPVLATIMTPSVNEQPALWCYQTVFQTIMFGIAVRAKELYKQPVLQTIHHPGAHGEKPLTYRLEHADHMEKEFMLGGWNKGV